VIRTIEIQNFKSIENIKLDLGRVNVFIGENGAGKSNLLEAIALVGAANAGKLDNEFLISRGIRVTQPQLMRPQFSGFSDTAPIEINIDSDGFERIHYSIQNDNLPYSTWNYEYTKGGLSEAMFGSSKLKKFMTASKENSRKVRESMNAFIESVTSDVHAITTGKTKSINKKTNFLSELIKSFDEEFFSTPKQLSNFVIYSPENTALRTFEKEGQVEPLGVNGEGLFKLLSVLSSVDNGETISRINKCLKVLGWFDGFAVRQETSQSSLGIDIYDRYLKTDKAILDHRSANEGFLFLVFYFALFSTDLTPDFFAIDNIDASLNPKLCSQLMKELSKLSVESNKQALFTTHNPAVLDGLNLDDDDQRLFVVSRSTKGQTRVKRIMKEAGKELKLSEMFMRGVLGGLPKGF
jgi:predicted ATPase